MKDLVIIGAGGFGCEIYMHIENIKKMVAKSGESYPYPLWNVVGFIDDNVTEMDAPYKYLGNLDTYLAMEDKPHFFVAVANSAARQRIAQRCMAAGCQPGSVIYPSAFIHESAVIGDGCYIGDRCGVSVNVKIGNFNIFQHHCGLGHDDVVGDFNSFMSETSIGGETTIGDNNYFGMRCTIINRVNIADNCTFGACACIVKDAQTPGTYVGVPAKLIKPMNKPVEKTTAQDLVIIGAGGFGREIYMHIENIKKMVAKGEDRYKSTLWNVVGFIDDNVTEMDAPYKYLGNLDTYLAMEDKPYFFVAVADAAARRRIAQRCMEAGGKPGSVIYPSLNMGVGSSIGKGCFISDYCSISVNAKIGDFNIIQGTSGFGHDAVVGDYNSFMTQTSCAGETTIGDNNYFGTRCTIINRINITDNCTFGACTCVVKDCDVPGTYVGVPAKLIKPLQK